MNDQDENDFLIIKTLIIDNYSVAIFNKASFRSILLVS